MSVLLAFSVCAILGFSQPGIDGPRRAVLESHYAKRFKGACVGTRENHPISFDSIKFCDVDGDSVEEAIINGSSCVSGTGGPDIHEVLKLNADGTITDITPPEGKGKGTPDTFHGQPIFNKLIGGRNFDISFQNGLLYYIFRDESGQPEPLILQFKWMSGKFKLIKVIKNGLTLRSTRTQPQAARSFRPGNTFTSSSLISSAAAGPVSFNR